jgi:hypothetical protein
LEAAIKEKFGLEVELKEGHNGILKVTMGDIVIFDNGSKCGQLPTVDDVIKAIRR